MLKGLPTYIDPKRLALFGDRLKGRVALALMSRLRDSLCDVQGDAQIDWLFALDDKQRPMISGRVHAQLPQQCQRCLQPMLTEIDTKMALVVLDSETSQNSQNEELPLGYETITLTSTPVSLITLIEDELILALPIVAKHTACPSNECQYVSSIAEDKTLKNNPFQVLSQLKNG
jgi:uncharacterized protein